MTLGRLMDHRCRVRKLTETTTPTNERVNSYTPASASAEEPLALAAMPASRVNRGAGARVVGTVLALMGAGADVGMNDVLEVFAGPNAPRNFRVLAPPDRPRGHHTEAQCEPFMGPL